MTDAGGTSDCGDDGGDSLNLRTTTTSSKQTAPRHPVGLSRRFGLFQFVSSLGRVAGLLWNECENN